MVTGSCVNGSVTSANAEEAKKQKTVAMHKHRIRFIDLPFLSFLPFSFFFAILFLFCHSVCLQVVAGPHHLTCAYYSCARMVFAIISSCFEASLSFISGFQMPRCPREQMCFFCRRLKTAGKSSVPDTDTVNEV